MAESIGKTRYHKAATASWLIFLAFFVFRMVTNTATADLPGGDAKIMAWVMIVLAILFFAIGFFSGIYALFGIRSNGPKGILVPSSVGILLNMIGLLFLGYLLVRVSIQ